MCDDAVKASVDQLDRIQDVMVAVLEAVSALSEDDNPCMEMKLSLGADLGRIGTRVIDEWNSLADSLASVGEASRVLVEKKKLEFANVIVGNTLGRLGGKTPSEGVSRFAWEDVLGKGGFAKS